MFPDKLHCEWDLAKALSNSRKHGVCFKDAASVFDDPLSLTRHNADHTGFEERWITIGEAGTTLLVVVHTLEEWGAAGVHIRIISARRPTADERRQYQTGKYRIEEAIMKSEHDDSEWVRGKFYREGARLMLPFYLEASVFRRVSRLAADAGVEATDLAGVLLTQAIERMDAEAGADRD